jgi:hypothetical protein
MRILTLMLVVSLGFTQCTTKTYTLDQLPQQFIEIGNYGGFTGASTSYYLLQNGQRFYSRGIAVASSSASGKELEPTKSKAFKAKLKELKRLGFSDIDFNEKGNMTHFVRLKTKKKNHTISWGDPKKAPQEVVAFYTTFLKDMQIDITER